ncbi:MAG: DUF1553 domain-containing protein, partial [Planctomycetota bacterium]|nr:DUF1553 domain-containing protein [Planctomycetota bacterium]
GGDERNHQKAKGSIGPGVPAVFAQLPPVSPVHLPAAAWYPAFDPTIEKSIKDDLQAILDAKVARFAKAQNEHDQAPSELLLLRLELARMELSAARADVVRVQTQLSAEKAKLDATEQSIRPIEQEAKQLMSLARDAQEEVTWRNAEAAVLAARVAVAEAELLADSTPNRATTIETAQTQLTEATKKKSQLIVEKSESVELPALTPVYPKISSGRRTALAHWLTHRANPLTARVAVNHIWLRHFHAPLVATVFDFGRNGAQPTHPELLDWLAVELQESNWSMKQLHRLIVTSAAYQRASGGNVYAKWVTENEALDSENRTLWRANTGRMESEVVRDAILFCSQRLDGTMGGQELENSEALTTYRRTLYYSCQPENDGTSEFGRLFDAPDPSQCYRRTRTILPQQSLALTNSDFVHQLSQNLAHRISTQCSESTSFVDTIFRRIVARDPTPEERVACDKFLAESSIKEQSMERRAALIRVVFNHNDFITVR